MSQKQEKRMRKMLRQKMHGFDEEVKKMAAENARIIKQKPKYIPLKLWMWILRRVLNIKK